MTNRRKSIFGWNHVSAQLSKEQVDELKSYYKTYHKKVWIYKKVLKRFKKMELLGNSLSILFASGGLAASIATEGIAIVAVSTGALLQLIQGWMKHKNLDLKIQQCVYAFQTYQHILNSIKNALRSGEYDSNHMQIAMTNTTDFITDNSPIKHKFLLKYDKLFTSEELN